MTLQIAELSLDTTASTTGTVFRIVEVTLDVSAGSGGNAPVLSGTVSPVGPVSAGTQVTMAITVSGSYTSTAWTLDVVSPPVELAQSPLSVSFVAPYLTDQTDVLVDVTATGPGGTSAPLTLAVTVMPHLSWYLALDGTWHPTAGNVLL